MPFLFLNTANSVNFKHQSSCACDDDDSTSTHSSFLSCYNIKQKKSTVLEFPACTVLTPRERDGIDLLLQAASLFPTPSPSNSDIPELHRKD